MFHEPLSDSSTNQTRKIYVEKKERGKKKIICFSLSGTFDEYICIPEIKELVIGDTKPKLLYTGIIIWTQIIPLDR